MDKTLGYLGIARKAGLIEIGEENAGAAARSGRCRVMLLASDASDNATSRAQGYVRGSKIPLVRLPLTKDDISGATGKNGCSMVAVTDVGIASAMLDALEEGDPKRYGGYAEELRNSRDRAARRRAEATAHERNIRTGKRRKDK